MDTSEQYIKMCTKAEEIQGKKPEGSQGEFVYCEGQVYQEVDDRPLTPFIWLPMQDQLQKMLPNTLANTHDIGKVRGLVRFVKSLVDGTVSTAMYISTLSLEQLWLAFVQKELYGKVWDGENWVK